MTSLTEGGTEGQRGEGGGAEREGESRGTGRGRGREGVLPRTDKGRVHAAGLYGWAFSDEERFKERVDR